MGINIISRDYAEQYVFGTKRCPGCGNDLPVTVELAADHWYIKKDGTPHGYCKSCLKKKVVRRRQEKRMGVPSMRTECRVCGQIRKVDYDENGVPTCGTCSTAWVACGGTVAGAIEILTWIHGHNKGVEERRAAHTSNRAFLPHPDGMYGEYPAFDHRDCLRIEASVRSVLRVLSAQRQSPGSP